MAVISAPAVVTLVVAADISLAAGRIHTGLQVGLQGALVVLCSPTAIDVIACYGYKP